VIKMNPRILGVVLLVFVGMFFVSSVHAIAGDINGDGKVDTKDISLVIAAFRSYPGSPRWNAACDVFNGTSIMPGPDGVVDMRDLAYVVSQFRKA
jgi:hypothetical protein